MSASRILDGDQVRVLSGRWAGRTGTFRGWTGRDVSAEIDLHPAGRARARRVRVTTITATYMERRA